MEESNDKKVITRLVVWLTHLKNGNIISINRLLGWLIRVLITWYYKRTHFWYWGWEIDDENDITIQSSEYFSSGYRSGFQHFQYPKETEEK